MLKTEKSVFNAYLCALRAKKCFDVLIYIYIYRCVCVGVLDLSIAPFAFDGHRCVCLRSLCV